MASVMRKALCYRFDIEAANTQTRFSPVNMRFPLQTRGRNYKVSLARDKLHFDGWHFGLPGAGQGSFQMTHKHGVHE